MDLDGEVVREDLGGTVDEAGMISIYCLKKMYFQ